MSWSNFFEWAFIWYMIIPAACFFALWISVINDKVPFKVVFGWFIRSFIWPYYIYLVFTKGWE